MHPRKFRNHLTVSPSVLQINKSILNCIQCTGLSLLLVILGGDREPPSHGLIKWWQLNPKPKKPKLKPVSQQPVQAETVQQVALQQIQQALPQVNILQAAVSSAGLSAVMMQPAVSSAMPALTTVNTSQLAQTQLLPTVTFTNGTIQVQSAPIQVSFFECLTLLSPNVRLLILKIDLPTLP